MAYAESDAAALAVVTDNRRARGQELTRRRKELHIFTISEFARRAGKTRNAVSAAESGEASPATYDELEAWLDSQIPEALQALADLPDPIEFDVTGPTTRWHVVVRGPMERADEVRRQVSELLRDIDDKPS